MAARKRLDGLQKTVQDLQNKSCLMEKDLVILIKVGHCPSSFENGVHCTRCKERNVE